MVLLVKCCTDLVLGKNGEVDLRMYINYFIFSLGKRFSNSFFRASIWQGHSLSPFLLTIVAENLGDLLAKAKDIGMIRVLNLGEKSLVF